MVVLREAWQYATVVIAILVVSSIRALNVDYHNVEVTLSISLLIN